MESDFSLQETNATCGLQLSLTNLSSKYRFQSEELARRAQLRTTNLPELSLSQHFLQFKFIETELRAGQVAGPAGALVACVPVVQPASLAAISLDPAARAKSRLSDKATALGVTAVHLLLYICLSQRTPFIPIFLILPKLQYVCP
jgi:hypothetical protein